MVPVPFDFFATGGLPAPGLPAEEVAAIARDFGLDGPIEPLGSQQDQNVRVGDAVLKIANPAFSEQELAAQDAAALAVAAACPDLRVAAPVAVRRVVTSAGPLTAKTLPFLPGGTLTDRRYLAPDVVARFGDLAARVSVALADFDHPGLERVLQWDLRESARVVAALADHHPDPRRREAVLAATAEAWARVESVAAGLPVQAGHFDLTDDNVVAGADGRLPDGIIDFGDVSRSWRVAELAVTLSCLLHRPDAEPHHVLPAVRAFAAVRPLAEAELDALWPLVVLRGAVLVVSGAHQVTLDEDNDYAASALEREWRIFAVATSVPIPVMMALVREALGQGRPRRIAAGARLLAEAPTPIDLSTTSPHADDGAWRRPGLADRVAAAHAAAAAAAPWGVARITEATGLAATSAATVPTAATVWLPRGTAFLAPWAGVLRAGDDGVEVAAPDGRRLVLHGVDGVEEGPVVAGTTLATARDGAAHVQVVAPGAPDVPPLVRPELAAGWLAQTEDPAPLLGLEPAPAASDPMPLRRAHLADVQEHYYADPPRIERGWAVHLVDTDARAYLDMVNNVTAIGHAHPAVTRAVARQLALLNTNSRFHYGAIAEYAAALADTLPDPLGTVFLVGSGSEAVDLALRLAMAATGRRDVVAVREAYHGWTYASDAVSTSIADNPNALATRPDWVHVVDAPNAYRGRHRDADAARYGQEAAAAIRAMTAAGSPPAAFVAEAFFGNAGGLPLPDGYLRQVYAAVREAGGVAIADEVQVGYGRLGSTFWGFEQQGVVPDVVAVAKSIGNGYPLGAVVTSAAIAARYREGGYFFSSTGGSPVSAVVGLTVLDVIRREGLQANAAAVGGRLKRGLEQLATRHPLIGAVHGSGLYLGVEFVRDRPTREPATAETAAICDRLLTLGVVMQPTGDFQNVLKVKPPLVLRDAEAAFFVEQLDRVLTDGW